MATEQQLGDAFKDFTDQVVERARAANAAREQMQDMMNQRTTTGGVIDTDGTSQWCNGAPIRDYEEALEALKDLIQNKFGNPKMEYKIGGARHYIRALDVQLDHGDPNKEYLITGVVARGLISVSPNDGNQAPSYSSKSSSSMVS